MKKIRIGIDMDGVIANWTKSAIINMNKLWNLNLKEEDITDVRTIDLIKSKLPELQDKDRVYFYKQVCPPKFFEELEPYPGAIQAVIDLSKIADIVFITKPLEYKYSAREKLNWLKKYFHFPFLFK